MSLLSSFSPDQANATCSPSGAKAGPLSRPASLVSATMLGDGFSAEGTRRRNATAATTSTMPAAPIASHIRFARFDAGKSGGSGTAGRDLTPRLRRRNEAVAAPGNGLDEAGRLRGIAQRFAQAVDDGVQTVLEVDERAVRPEALAQLLARDQIPGPIQQLDQHFERLFLQADEHARLAQLARCRSSSKLLNRSGRRAGAGISAIATPCQDQSVEAATS